MNCAHLTTNTKLLSSQTQSRGTKKNIIKYDKLLMQMQDFEQTPMFEIPYLVMEVFAG